MMMGTFAEIDEKRKSHWYHHPWFLELLQLFWLDAAGTEPMNFSLYESIISDYNGFLDKHPAPRKPLVSGEDVMDMLGLKPGEQVGEILKKVYEEQNAGKITLKKEAVDFIKKLNAGN